MRIVVSAQGENLEALASPVFGRCPAYVFVDTETMEAEAVANPAMAEGGGAGIQAAQFVVSQGAQAVLTGNLGPNAYDVLEAAGVAGYLVPAGTVREAVKAYKAGQLQPMMGANVAAHAGMGGGMGFGRGQGRGMGRGRRAGGELTVPVAAPVPAEPEAVGADEGELRELQETLKRLRRQLADTMVRIEQLEKEA
jgi:predicted Fe-Mo cluster-binding NifX family protein